MGFADVNPITNLASVQAAEDERKRKQALIDRSAEAEALKSQQADELKAESTDAAGLLASFIKRTGGKVPVSDAMQKNADEVQFLDENRHARLARQENAIAKQAQQLTVPGPTALERAATMSAPLGRFATEPPTREDLPELERLKTQMASDPTSVSRETSPLFTDAPRRGGATDAMPYAGALAGLQGADVPRSAIRKEFGGTAPETTLSFSDAQGRQPGMRPYGTPGRREDVGAPGGGLSTVAGKGPGAGVEDAQRASIDSLIREVQQKPKTERELAGQILSDEPTWDTLAGEMADPQQIALKLTQAVAEGSLDPQIAERLQKKYAGIGGAVFKETDGRGDPKLFRQYLSAVRMPDPREAEMHARTGGQEVPAVEAEKQQAVQSALQAPEDGPGSTRSPALATAGGTNPDALLREMQQPRGQSMTVPGVGGEVGYEMNAPFIPEGMGQGPAVPPWMADLPENIRLALGGASFAAGGKESQAERQRRLAREAARRG